GHAAGVRAQPLRRRGAGVPRRVADRADPAGAGAAGARESRRHRAAGDQRGVRTRFGGGVAGLRRRSLRADRSRQPDVEGCGRMALPREQALERDAQDPLARFRERFVRADPELIYMDGNSLGRLPVDTRARLHEVVEEWGTELVAGWHDW